MTAKGSVTPWMACGDRPVKGIPEPGAFPAAGIPPSPGIVKGRGIAPLPAPAKREVGKPPKPTKGGTDRAVPHCLAVNVGLRKLSANLQGLGWCR